MYLAEPSVVFFVAVLVQALGLASVVAVRVVGDISGGPTTQCLFFTSLSALGIVTMLMVLSGSILWLPCGITLSIMVVGATLDLGNGAADTTW